MRKIISLLLILITTVCFTYAIAPTTGLISRDSMRTKWANGKKFLMHKVQKGETFYSIARDYKVDVKELMNANKGVTSLKANQIIQVPVSENFVASAKQAEETVKPTSEQPVEKSPPAMEKPITKTESKNIYHTVKKGETLSEIAKKYNVPVKTISDWNDLKKNQIRIGEKLIVKKENTTGAIAEPKTTDKTSQNTVAEHASNSGTDVMHTVKKGETLYGISKLYGANSKDVIEWNEIKNNNVKIGQQLIVKKGSENALPKEIVRAKSADESTMDAPKTAEVEKKVTDVKEASESNADLSKNEKSEKPVEETPPSVNTEIIDKTPSGKNIKQSIETGEAAWVNDGDLNPNKYFALHRTAPIGTIMKVTNRMNGKYVFVKVIGKLPGTGDNEKLIIKLSKAAADRLGVIDPTFQCELNYAFASE
ncbi:MAG: LysM peptidoglycan-binding domain-containing protein [Bacteroidia bacterium]